jgi:hypothetical protein
MAALFLSLPMMADTTYYYTGNNFTIFATQDTSANTTYGSASYNTGDSVTGWFSVRAPLPAASPGFPLAPIAFSFSDGQQTINSTDVINGTAGILNGDFAFITGSNGNIVDWELLMLSYTDEGPTGAIYMFGGPYFSVGNGPVGGYAGDLGGIIHSDGSTDFGESATSGSWSTTPPSTTPEPSSIVLLLTGLASMAGVARRKLGLCGSSSKWARLFQS